ncbi:hypothetical protein AB205_0014010, partial [Aquarana catesbeiana]
MALMGQDRSSLSIEVIFPDITSFFCWLREGVKEKRKIGTNAFLFLDSHWQTGCLRCSKMQVTTEASNERKPLVDSSHRSHSSSSYPYTHNPSVLSYEPQHYPTQIQHPSHEVLAPSMVGEAHRPP